MRKYALKKPFIFITVCSLILLITGGVFLNVMADDVSQFGNRLVTGINVVVDNEEIDGGNSVKVTASFMDTANKPEPVIVSVTEGGILPAESESDIVFTTNGIGKDITDLHVSDDLDRMTFTTGAPVARKVSKISFDVEAPIGSSTFDIHIKVGTGIGSATKTIKITSGLTIEAPDMVNDVDSFYITGLASYKGQQPPDPSYIFVEIVNKETDEPIDEIQFLSEIVNKEYSFGPITLPSTYDDGVYVIKVYMMHNDIVLLGTCEKEIIFQKVDRTATITMKPDKEIYSDSRVVDIKTLDENNLGIPNNTILLSVSGDGVLSNNTVRTDENGNAQVIVSDSTDEYVILTATSMGGVKTTIPVDFREIPNLAFNQIIRVSDVLENNIELHGAEKLIDGFQETMWASGDSEGAWIEVDFEEPRAFNKVTMREFDNGNTMVGNFGIEYFSDGKWKTAYKGANSELNIVARFPEVTGEKVRIKLIGDNISLHEIGVFKTNSYMLTIRDTVKGVNAQGDILTANTTMRQFNYKGGESITDILPLDYTNITVDIPDQYSDYLTADGSKVITGIMPEDDVTISYEYEYRIDDPEGPIKELIKINILETNGSIQLKDKVEPFNFIWVANSSKGTVVKINTDTGDVLAEYKTSPDGQPADPSRTTVDKDGSVWIANRAGNSITKIGLKENGQWIDKNGNGVCDTSTGLNDIKGWSNAGGADTNGGVSTAEDECIIQYVRTSSGGTRHVSVDENNNVWVSGTLSRKFDLIDTKTGEIIRSEGPVGYGGYGGLIDKNGVIWSSTGPGLLRWDTKNPLAGANGINWNGYDISNHNSYGLAIDSQGNIWNSNHARNGQLKKISSDGTVIGSYNQGNISAQGVVVGKDDDIWVAHSMYETTVGHLKNDGTFVGSVPVAPNAGGGPTGVAVDDKGFIWATCYNGTVVKIDPNLGPIGADGVTRVGQVIFVSNNLGGLLYNYSDMTGSTLAGAPDTGTWEFVYDSKVEDVFWNKIGWEPEDNEENAVEVWISTSKDNLNFSQSIKVTNNSEFSIPEGRYIKVRVQLNRSAGGISPIINTLNVSAIMYDEE